MAYLSIDDFNYSLFRGNAMYRFKGETLVNPMKGLGEENMASPVLYDFQTGESFFTRRLRYYDDEMTRKDVAIHKHYIQLIKNPPKGFGINYIWPKDLVELNSETLDAAQLFMVQSHRIYEKDVERDGSKYGLLFASDARDGLENCNTLVKELQRRKELNYKNPQVQKMIVGIVKRIEELNDSGYIYYDFNFSRFFISSNNSIVLDFSNLLYHTSEVNDLMNGKMYLEEPLEVFPDFAEPASFLGEKLFFDQTAQDFGLSAFIFFLMYGRHPYDGPLLENFFDDGYIGSHYRKYTAAQQMPIFIFDPDNKSNAIGDFGDERSTLDLWNETPEFLRDIFIKVLSENNAKRSNTTVFRATTNVWKDVAKCMGWS